MGIMDIFGGGGGGGGDGAAPQGAGPWPFLAGFGNNSYVTFDRQYNQPTGFNPGAFPAGMYNQPPAGGQPGGGNYASPGQPGYGGGIFGGPTSGWQQPNQQPGGQYTTMGGPTSGYQGYQQSGYNAPSPQGSPAPQGSPTGQPQGQYAPPSFNGQQFSFTPRFTGDNGTFSAPTDNSWIPGMMPSLAGQVMQGPAEYYPYYDVALKTQDQITADQLGRSLGTNEQFANVYNSVTNQLMGDQLYQNNPQSQYNDFASRLASGNMNQNDPGQFGINQGQFGMGMYGPTAANQIFDMWKQGPQGMDAGLQSYLANGMQGGDTNNLLTRFSNGMLRNPLGENGLDQANTLLGASGDLTGYATGLLDRGLNFGSSFDRGGLDAYTGAYRENPALTGVIDAMGSDAARIMNEKLLPVDRANAINSGQYGGSRSGIAEGLTRSRVGEEVTQQAGNMRYQDYNDFSNRAIQAGSTLANASVAAQNAAANRAGVQSNYNINRGNLLNSAINSGTDLLNTAGNLNLGGGDLAANLENSRANTGVQWGDLASRNDQFGRTLDATWNNNIANLLQNGYGQGMEAYSRGYDALYGAGNIFQGAAGGQRSDNGQQIQGLLDAAGLQPAQFGQLAQQIEMLRSIGLGDQALNQLMINSDKNRWDYGQNAPMDLMRQWGGILNGVPQPNGGGGGQQGGGTGPMDYLMSLGMMQGNSGNSLFGSGIDKIMGMFGG